jgi:hypothetical protein
MEYQIQAELIERGAKIAHQARLTISAQELAHEQPKEGILACSLGDLGVTLI